MVPLSTPIEWVYGWQLSDENSKLLDKKMNIGDYYYYYVKAFMLSVLILC